MSKLYIPENLKNQNYTYYISNDYTITIRTNENCYTQYQTQYCDCLDLFPKLDYINSNRYSCSVSSYTHTINYNDITSDTWYSLNKLDSLIMFVILAYFIILIPFKIFKRLFGRWFNI